MATTSAPSGQATTAEFSQGQQSSGGNSTPWYKRGWVIAVAGLVLGLIIGTATAGTSDPKQSPEYKSLSADLGSSRHQVEENDAKLSSTEDKLSSTQDELTSTQDELASTKSRLTDVVGDLPAREKAVKKGEAALRARSADLRKAEGRLRAKSKAVARRERKVGIVEKDIAKNTIAGDGTYQVGVDMKPGLYKTSGSTDCYYAVNGDANGNDIKSNNITSGPATATVKPGEYFETSGCADWVLQH